MVRMLALVALLLPAQVWAFEPVVDGAEFRRLVLGQELTRLGIRLEVRADGQITGRGLGSPVSGQWRWQDGYFCRSLYWGERDLGTDCQAVQREGDEMRFITERGAGIHADFRLR